MSTDKKEIENILKEAHAVFHQLSAEEQENLSNTLKTLIEKNKPEEQTAPENANDILSKHQDEEFGVLDFFSLPSIFASVLCTLMLIASYHFWVNQKASIAVVDVSEVLTIQQSQFVKLLSSGTVTDKQREESFTMVAGFGDRLKAAIDSVQKDCQCTLIVKNAVIGEVSDYTESLKAKMGMAGLKADDKAKNAAVQNIGGVANTTSSQEDMLKGLR